jgi:demethylmenaquinone methyltransferase/2-methoxy-6-polyprenyl-1,4-benzoquinol methylase
MSLKNTEISRVTRTRAQAKTAYDRMSRWYDLMSGSFEARYRRQGVQMLQPHAGDRILEIGFGTGHSLLELAEAAGDEGRVYGIDLSPGMLDVARKRIAKAGLQSRVEMSCGDATQLPYADASFDKVFISFTLELFDTPDIPKVLAECRRVLRDGGRIAVVALSKNGGSNFSTHIYEWFHKRMPSFVDCRPIYTQAALIDAGFRIIESREQSSLGLHFEMVLAGKQ